jgi:hypothetical protein
MTPRSDRKHRFGTPPEATAPPPRLTTAADLSTSLMGPAEAAAFAPEHHLVDIDGSSAAVLVSDGA